MLQKMHGIKKWTCHCDENYIFLFYDLSDWISVAATLPPLAQHCQDKHFDIWHYLTIGNKSLWRSDPNFERIFSWGMKNASYPHLYKKLKQARERSYHNLFTFTINLSPILNVFLSFMRVSWRSFCLWVVWIVMKRLVQRRDSWGDLF